MKAGPERMPAMQLVRRFLSDRSGATAIEYALIGGVMTVAIAAGFGAMSQQLGILYDSFVNAFPQ